MSSFKVNILTYNVFPTQQKDLGPEPLVQKTAHFNPSNIIPSQQIPSFYLLPEQQWALSYPLPFHVRTQVLQVPKIDVPLGKIGFQPFRHAHYIYTSCLSFFSRHPSPAPLSLACCHFPFRRALPFIYAFLYLPYPNTGLLYLARNRRDGDVNLKILEALENVGNRFQVLFEHVISI